VLAIHSKRVMAQSARLLATCWTSA